MTRQLVDVLRTAFKEMSIAGWTGPSAPDRFVASLLTEPAEHTIICPTCDGTGGRSVEMSPGDFVRHGRCPNCTNGRQTVIVRAEVKR